MRKAKNRTDKKSKKQKPIKNLTVKKTPDCHTLPHTASLHGGQGELTQEPAQERAGHHVRADDPGTCPGHHGGLHRLLHVWQWNIQEDQLGIQ